MAVLPCQALSGTCRVPQRDVANALTPKEAQHLLQAMSPYLGSFEAQGYNTPLTARAHRDTVPLRGITTPAANLLSFGRPLRAPWGGTQNPSKCFDSTQCASKSGLALEGPTEGYCLHSDC